MLEKIINAVWTCVHKLDSYFWEHIILNNWGCFRPWILSIAIRYFDYKCSRFPYVAKPFLSNPYNNVKHFQPRSTFNKKSPSLEGNVYSLFKPQIQPSFMIYAVHVLKEIGPHENTTPNNFSHDHNDNGFSLTFSFLKFRVHLEQQENMKTMKQFIGTWQMFLKTLHQWHGIVSKLFSAHHSIRTWTGSLVKQSWKATEDNVCFTVLDLL